MTTFPAIKPDRISYNLGALNLSEVATTGSGPIRFRHSMQVNGHVMQLQYANLVQSQVDQIRSHYIENDGGHGTFVVPSAIWGDADVVPTDSLYRYTSPPEEEHFGVYTTIQVNLRILVGTDLLYILNCDNAQQPAESSFTSFAFSGTAPFILNARGI